VALVIAGGVAAAWAQPARPDSGYIGRGTGTEEIDACRAERAERDESPEDARERRARAAEHYDRGLALYEQGDYTGAIAEFVAAYCHEPSYLMYYNIAQSFERQVDYEKAVAYLERFILESPEEEEQTRERIAFRVQVLRNLPARIRVATVPPGVTARGVSNEDEPLLVRKGTYQMTVEAEGHEPITESIEVAIGQPYSYYFRLEPLEGTVRIVTDPPDARIFVDQRLVALGSYVEALPIGRYTVTVEASERLPATRELEVTAGQQSSLRLELERLPRSGRRQLLVASTIGGGLFGGGAFTTVFGEDTLFAGLGGLAGVGIGFAGAYFGAPQDISVGSSSYLIGTTLIGAAQGLTVATLFACDEADDGGEQCRGNVVAGASLAAGIGGLLFGTVTTGRFDLDAGDAALINSGALWGSVAGGLLYAAFDFDRRVRGPLLLAGLNLGLVAGGGLAARSEVSRGHVALVDLSGLAGMIAGVALVDVVEPGTRSERLPHFALAGMAVGLITGTYLTRNMDEPSAQPLRTITPTAGAATDAAGNTSYSVGLGGSF
jgi:hypothetical protein